MNSLVTRLFWLQHLAVSTEHWVNAMTFTFCLVTLVARNPHWQVNNKKKIYSFSVNTMKFSSRKMKTLKFSLVLRTRENIDVFITLYENIYGIHNKSKYPLCFCGGIRTRGPWWPCNAHLSNIALWEPDPELIKANILIKVQNDYNKVFCWFGPVT